MPSLLERPAAMVAIDSAFEPLPAASPETAHTGRIMLFAMLMTALVAAIGFTLGEDGTGWGLAADWASRCALLVFVAAMTVEPLSHLLRLPIMRLAARERVSLVMAFIAAMAISVALDLAPWLLAGKALAAPTFAYCIVTGAILVVMLFSNHPATVRLLGAPSWRAMQRIACAYFWTVFALTSMGRLIGPHRPDDWHGVALLLLAAAVLLRFGDALLLHWRGGLAEKVG